MRTPSRLLELGTLSRQKCRTSCLRDAPRAGSLQWFWSCKEEPGKLPGSHVITATHFEEGGGGVGVFGDAGGVAGGAGASGGVLGMLGLVG